MKTKLLALPVDEFIEPANELLEKFSNLVIMAAPGAGKTTRIPPGLVDLVAPTGKQIWVLEPRRMAAVAAAHRIAEEQGWQLGQEVGYQVRFESKASPQTQILFLTEALLARKFLQDPDLSTCGLVILDEFHERSLQVDLALGLLKEAQMLNRPDLKIVVMSATLNPDPLLKFLTSAAHLEIPGRLFDLEIEYGKASQTLRTDHVFIDRVYEALFEHLRATPKGKDILVFLPGFSEISRLQKKIETASWSSSFLLLPLLGSLSLEDQLRALRPAQQRKIILATNVAESSVTVDGIDTVLDTGLQRSVSLHPQTGFERIEMKRISKASAKQRAGRAARQFPGKCIRLWTKADELSMAEFEVGEIHRRDLSEVVLFLHQLGISQAAEFSWFERPDLKKLAQAEDFLLRLGCLNPSGALTALGKRLAQLPIAPRLGKILCLSADQGEPQLGAEIAALLQERDILAKSSVNRGLGCDLLERLEALPQLHTPLARTVKQAAQQLAQLVRAGQTPRKTQDPDFISNLLLQCYPDRICRKRREGSLTAQMVGGRGVQLVETSAAKNSEFFIALEIMETEGSADSKVSLASCVSRRQIEFQYKHLIEKKSQIVFAEEQGSYFHEEWLELDGLRLEEPRRRPAQASELAELLPEIMTSRLSYILNQNGGLQAWWSRWQFFAKQKGIENLFDQEKIFSAFSLASFNERSLEQVISKDLVYFFESQLEPQLLQEFHNLVPEKALVPSGSWIKINYHLDKPPHLEVRLQELFGLNETPTVWAGKINVTLHLLAPNYRPVQVTSDLASFWDTTYSEVKSELKSRYPKHSWPDNPRTAPAQAKGRPRNQ